MVLGPLVARADQLPAYCGPIGAKSYTPPEVTVPPVVLNRGIVITVTNATVAINGDTSSVAALVANPGADGISIEEAIVATNNDPGTWNIQFAPSLKGATIVVDSGSFAGLSFLAGGNVTISGDVDGDGQPDITLTSASAALAGFFVTSGGNTIYGLALKNFQYGVVMNLPGQQAVTGTTYSGITIANLVISQIQNSAILLSPEWGVGQPGGPAMGIRSNWDHLLITGNTITGSATGPVLGIDLEVGNTAGDALKDVIIANNNIAIPMTNGGGIAMNFGAGPGAAKNQALDMVIANNTISGVTPQFGIRLATGVGSASASLVDGVQIIGNQISATRPPPPARDPFPAVAGIILVSGDAASDDQFPALRPIQYSENNTMRNVSVLSNTMTGAANFGIQLEVACCGNASNTIDSLSIQGNTITGVVGNAMVLTSGSSGGYYSRPTTRNELSNVKIQANTIHLTPLIYPGCGCYPAGSGVTLGGIQVWAGLREPGNRVDGLSITNNEVDTGLPGIVVIAGWGAGGELNNPPMPANQNVVSSVQISCNQVDQAPTLGVDFPQIQGIDVIAGLLAPSFDPVQQVNGNQVQQVTVVDNLAGGVLGPAALFGSLGGGVGNTVSITLIDGLANGPQFTAAGLINAATFQQRALAPGSLVSLFGSNLTGATVQFGATSAPVLFASSSQLNLQVPWELQGQSSSPVTVTVNSVTSAPQTIAIAAADPGIFSLGAPQSGQGAIVNLAGLVVDANSPAHVGDYLQIYATGLGPVSNTPQTGAVAGSTPLSYLIGKAAVTIGGVAAPVGFTGLTPGFVGLYQLNVQVPPGVAAGDGVPVIVSIGATTSNTVTISVR